MPQSVEWLWIPAGLAWAPMASRPTGMGFIGAAVYFIGHAGTFWLGVLGFFRAVF